MIHLVSNFTDRKLPTFWLGVASLFDFTGSIAQVVTSDINSLSVAEAIRQDALRVAEDMHRVYERERTFIDLEESCEV